MIYGMYCECDNFSCPQKCSGRGTCDCGVCQCDPGNDSTLYMHEIRQI